MADSSIGRMDELNVERVSRVEQEGYPHTAIISGEKSANLQNPVRQSEGSTMKTTKTSPIVGSLSEVRLHFKVDPVTHEVTVLVLDRTTRKVIRTIPPEELAKLQQGELLELTR